MSEGNIQILLEKPITWAGTNYAPGLNEMPEAAAKSAAKRKFGKIVGESEAETKAEEKIDFPEDFPRRQVFEKLGFKSVMDVQSKTAAELIAYPGIAQATADAALAYGK